MYAPEHYQHQLPPPQQPDYMDHGSYGYNPYDRSPSPISLRTPNWWGPAFGPYDPYYTGSGSGLESLDHNNNRKHRHGPRPRDHRRKRKYRTGGDRRPMRLSRSEGDLVNLAGHEYEQGHDLSSELLSCGYVSEDGRRYDRSRGVPEMHASSQGTSEYTSDGNHTRPLGHYQQKVQKGKSKNPTDKMIARKSPKLPRGTPKDITAGGTLTSEDMSRDQGDVCINITSPCKEREHKNNHNQEKETKSKASKPHGQEQGHKSALIGDIEMKSCVRILLTVLGVFILLCIVGGIVIGILR